MKQTVLNLKISWLLLFSLFFFGASSYEAPQSKIQIALLLDTSNSMDGLIDQAKGQLWNVVNEFALARYKGEAPDLEIALYEYGNSGLAKRYGYIRKVVPLSTDLDRISEELFALQTNGGDEYCGQVIQSALSDLEWSNSNDNLKMIFVAGNEPFDQGKVDFRRVCRETISAGIIVNTIFCGNKDEGVRTFWKEGADLADGKYMNINQNERVVHIDAPQDREINRLNEALNDTYLAYGDRGRKRKERQVAQDRNASLFGSANQAQRALTKSSAKYKNEDWDLVDAVEEESVDLEEVAEDDLPKEMRTMSPSERRDYVDEKKSKRNEIKKQIQVLSIEREKYVAEKRREAGKDDTLGKAILEAVRQQATTRGYVFSR